MNKNWIHLLGVPLSMLVAPVFATEYLSVEAAQRTIFPNAEIFVENFLALTDEQNKQIKKMSGNRQRWDLQQIWRAEKEGKLLGWFIVDNVVGKHEFITYALGVSPAGEAMGIEIMTYRETHGDEVRDAQWREQFQGKTLDDPFKLNEDIPNITGATLSARNLTDGVKRLLTLQKLLLSDE
jgi:electron transport complex protein RnfG